VPLDLFVKRFVDFGAPGKLPIVSFPKPRLLHCCDYITSVKDKRVLAARARDWDTRDCFLTACVARKRRRLIVFFPDALGRTRYTR